MSDSAEILRDEANVVRRVSHARSPYRPDDFTPASPVTLAKWYLEKFGDQFGLPRASLMPQQADIVGAHVESKLALSDVKSVRDSTTVVSFAQTYANLPIFEAGVAVTVRQDLSGVISAESTLHLDIKLDNIPHASSQEEAYRFTSVQLARVLGIASKTQTPEIESLRLVIYRYLPERRLHPDLAQPNQPESSPKLDLPSVPGTIVAGSITWCETFSSRSSCQGGVYYIGVH